MRLPQVCLQGFGDLNFQLLFRPIPIRVHSRLLSVLHLPSPHFLDKAKLFHGEVLGLKDEITFQGTSVKELEKAMAESVDFYIAWCKERNKVPEKPFSGKVFVRTSPDLHSRASVAAARLGLSLNKFIEKAIEDETMHVIAQ